MQVLVKVFLERPYTWNAEGLMDELMGKVVEAEKNGSQYCVRRRESGTGTGYTWILPDKDIIPVKDIPQIEFCEEGLTSIDIILRIDYHQFEDMMNYMNKIHPDYFTPIPIEKIQALSAQFPEFLQKLKDNKIVKSKEVFYRTGQRFLNKDGEEAILAQVDYGCKVCLICLNSGNRVKDPIQVKSIFKITEKEFSEINGTFTVYHLKD